MSAAAPAPRAQRLSRSRVLWAAATTTVAIAAAASFVVALPAREAADAATVSVPVTPANADVLVNATTGPASADFRVVGTQAKLINAALPFGRDPIEAARPFTLSGTAVDARRALKCLTQAVYYEAGFEPVEGRRAVAQVVLNRVRHPAFPKSICGVVYQGAGMGTCQFTFVCDGSLDRAPAADAWKQAEQIARAALSGYVEAAVGEATHYHADYVAPRWAPMLTKVSQIGQHIFYRWPGAWGDRAIFAGRYIGEPADPASLRPAREVALVQANTDAESAAAARPPVPRAPNDVGGLLDTSTGWRLDIPTPDESGSRAARLIAAQQAKPLTTQIAATAPGPQVASR